MSCNFKFSIAKSLLFTLVLLSGLWLTSCDKGTIAPLSTTNIQAYPVMSIGEGGILREEWDNVPGITVEDIPVNEAPSQSNIITSLEGPVNYRGNYGSRIRGFVTPPSTGDYTFWIAGDDAAELWLSTDSDPLNKKRIAQLLYWTDYHEWNKYGSQQSQPITLEANHQYYVEVLHKQGGGSDNVSVQWMLPNHEIESPIPGSRLSQVATQAYTSAAPVNLYGAHDITISGEAIIGGSLPAINLSNCYNIHITQNKLYNSTDVGIHLYQCKNITIDNNYFTNVSSGVYAEQTTEGGIQVNHNQFLNMKGPFPRGQFVQFNNVNGAGNSISFNKGENILGQSYPEDAINLFHSSGTANSSIMINGNWIRGGGPSSSGGGIMLGDEGGSYLSASDNILVNPGEYGMAVAGGDHIAMLNNIIYGKSQYFTNVGLYVNGISLPATLITVSGNKIRYYNKDNYQNNWWLAPGTDKPEGWDTANILGAAIDESILPVIIITAK